MTNSWPLRSIDAVEVQSLRPATLFNLKEKVAIVTGAGGGPR